MYAFLFPTVLLLGLGLQAEPATETGVSVPAPETSPPPLALDTVAVVAPEPRFVAPTRHDQIGRVWAPVSINGQGPFRLVVDTGASHSALTPAVAAKLGLSLDSRHQMMLRGATGSLAVPVVPIETLEIGELLVEPRRLPVIPDALGGAEGILGTDGLANKRIHIDFQRDNITIMRSRNQKAGPGFITIPVSFLRGRLLAIDANLGGVPVIAIVDTGGQATLGNEALRKALDERRRKQLTLTPEDVIGATLDVQAGNHGATPSLAIGDVLVRNSAMTFADFAIFEHWKMTGKPTMLIGMDVLGRLDTLIIDYRRRELQVKLRGS